MFLGHKKSLPRHVPKRATETITVMEFPCFEDCHETLYAWGETENGTWYQHGENPERRRFVRRSESGYAWLLSAHEYLSRSPSQEVSLSCP
jgi:hypothetical protein